MIAATVVMVAGIGMVALLSQTRGYRMGGVMVLPLLVVYTFREPLSLVIFVAGTVAAWGALWAAREYTLNHGRRLFLVAVSVGALATIVVGFLLSVALPERLPFESAEVIASIFPGVTAYNLMRVDADDRRADLLAMAGGYVVLVGVGLGALWVLAEVGSPTPPVLALPTSDVVDWVGIEARGAAFPRMTPQWLTVGLLVVDVVVYELARKRYDHRLAGIIVIPLLAVFSARYGNTVVVYGIGATAVFLLLSYVHWATLLYGRVLLGISLVLGSLYTLALGVWQPASAPGITLFFIGLFVGIGAYNLHRVAPKNRGAHIRISAGLFVGFYAVLLWFVDVPESALVQSFDLASVFLGLLVLGLGLVEVVRFERSIPGAEAFARESVFGNVDIDGVDVEDSPLVADHEDR